MKLLELINPREIRRENNSVGGTHRPQLVVVYQ